MKKSICILLVLIGFSAFAFSPNHGSSFQQSKAKVARKKAAKQPIAPLADLAIFSL